MSTLQEEIAAEQSIATYELIGKLRVAYDTSLRKAASTLSTKFKYGKLLCYSVSRGCIRQGVELLRELQAYLTVEIQTKRRAVSCNSPLVHSSKSQSQDSEYVFVNERSMVDNKPAEEREESIGSVSDSDIEHFELDEEELSEQCMYHIAVAYFRLGDYRTSARLCDELLFLNENHPRAGALRNLCMYSIVNRGALGFLLTVGVALPLLMWHKTAAKS